MKSIRELSDVDLYCIADHGYIGGYKMKELAEMHFFYNQIEEEIKRRELHLNTKGTGV